MAYWFCITVFLYIYKVAIIKEIFFQILSINPDKEIKQSDTSNWKNSRVYKLSSGLWFGMQNSFSAYIIFRRKKIKKMSLYV